MYKCKTPGYFVKEAKESFQEYFERFYYKSEKIKSNNNLNVSNHSLRFKDIDEMKRLWEKDPIAVRDIRSKEKLFNLICGFDYDKSCPYFALLTIYNGISEEVEFLYRIPVFIPNPARPRVTAVGAIGGLVIGGLLGGVQGKNLVFGAVTGAITTYVMNFITE